MSYTKSWRARVSSALFGLLVLGASLPSHAANTYYVAKTTPSGTPSSNANPGTSALPKLTILAGAALLSAGDTLIVRAGTYNERIYNGIPSGTSWATRTIVKAEVAGTVTLTPTAGGSDIFNIWFFGSNVRYIEIDGFILEGGSAVRSQYGVLINTEAHHIRIQNCEIRNTLSNGVFASAGQNPGTDAEGKSRSCCNEFINLNVHHTATTAVLGQAGGGHGIYASTSYNIIERSWYHDNPGYGIHVYSSYGGVLGNIVRYNRVHNNNLKKNPAGVTVGSGSGHQVYNNVIYDNAGGITLTSGGSSIYNNTIINNSISPGADSDIGIIANAGATFRNNIVCGHTNGNVAGPAAAGITAQANNIFCSSAATMQFANLGAKNFALTASSPARNAGTTLSAVPDDYVGLARTQGAYDIGAYEYNEGGAPPALGVTITSPTSNPTLATTNPTASSVAGTATGTGFAVTFTCPTCTPSSGSASGTASWTLPPLTLAAGANVITVTATAGASTASDSLTITYTASPVATPLAVLGLTHTCGTSSNVLGAQVLGSLLYLPAASDVAAQALGQGSCASSVTITDTASVLGGGIPATAPWNFLGTAGPNTGNSCTNCLSLHNGTASTNQAGSGYTLTTFREGSSLAAATGGTSAFTLLPQLCYQVVDGVTTATKLWPWPMDARLQAARTLAVAPSVSVTNTVQALLGPLPAACTTTPPIEPGATTWFLAPATASPPGVDGAACSLTAPCATFTHVASKMAPGHTLYLRGGTYAQRITPGLFPAGTSWSAPTTIAAYETESVTLQLTTGRLLDFGTADRFLVLTGLTIDGSALTSTTTNGLVVNGAGPLRFQNGTIRNTRFERVLVTNGVGIELRNSVLQSGTLLAAVRVRGSTNGLVLQGNTMHGGPSHGIQVESGTLTNASILQNSVQGHPNGTCLLLSVGTGTVIENNVLAGCGAGLVIEEDTTGTHVRYNTIADHSASGLVIDPGVSGVAITNTIVARNPVNLADSGTGTVQTTNLLTDPGFVGGTDYKLALASSPAADAGTCLPGVAEVALDGIVRPQPTGGACDIGAYERSGDDVDPPVPTPGPLSARPYGSTLFFVP